MAYENYTVRQFEKAWLNEDFSELPKDIFEEVYTEYVDTTGAYMSEQFDKVVYIRFLSNRLYTISSFINLQYLFFEEFKKPYEKKFYILEQYGYYLTWNDDEEDFFKQLKDIKDTESFVDSDLKICLKELEDLKKNQPKEEMSKIDKVRSWMNCVNSLVKIGYTIDKEKMTVQELSYIIKYEKEQNQKDGR